MWDGCQMVMAFSCDQSCEGFDMIFMTSSWYLIGISWNKGEKKNLFLNNGIMNLIQLIVDGSLAKHLGKPC
jgi:hypothetical protein